MAGVDGAACEVWPVINAEDPIVSEVKQLIVLYNDHNMDSLLKGLSAGVGSPDELVRRYSIDAATFGLEPKDCDKGISILLSAMDHAPDDSEKVITDFRNVRMAVERPDATDKLKQAVAIGFSQRAVLGPVATRAENLGFLADIVRLTDFPGARKTLTDAQIKNLRQSFADAGPIGGAGTVISDWLNK
jgi:hypothetical protein